MKQTNIDRPIILVGGGTGGHIFPLVAIGEELKIRNQRFIYVGTRTGREAEIISRLGWSFVSIEAGKWRRHSGLSGFGQNLVDLGRTIAGVFQAIVILRRTNARLIVGKGGGVALPVIVAAKLTRRPVIIHESDVVMGMANRLSMRFAHRILTTFNPTVFPFYDQRFVQVGMPIRQSLRQAARLKGPKKSRPLVLILPGSQGSSAINNYVKGSLNQLLKVIDIIHLTGEKDYPTFAALQQAMPSAMRNHYKPYRFIDRELPYYFQAADLVVARASATTATEAALFRKPLYMIPLPTAANNHQVANAKVLQRAGAAVVKEQYQLTPEIFRDDVLVLLKNEAKLTKLGNALHDYFNEEKTLEKILESFEAAKEEHDQNKS